MRKSYNNGGESAEDKALSAFAELMIEKISSLKSSDKWQRPWFSEAGLAWPKNMSGREYNGMNAVMLKMLAEKNKWDIPVYATFNRLTSLNYQKDPVTAGPIPLKDSDGKDVPRVMVNKGEKSVPVFITTFTVINKDTKEKIPYDDYRLLDTDEQAKFNVYPKLNVYNVFNVAGQTNLKEARPEVYVQLRR